MKRHSSLVSLSHDHHHALVRARQLRRAAQGEAAVRRAEAASFVRFFVDETVRHFREEEERLFAGCAARSRSTGFFGQNFDWTVGRVGSFPVFLGLGVGSESSPSLRSSRSSSGADGSKPSLVRDPQKASRRVDPPSRRGRQRPRSEG